MPNSSMTKATKPRTNVCTRMRKSISLPESMKLHQKGRKVTEILFDFKKVLFQKLPLPFPLSMAAYAETGDEGGTWERCTNGFGYVDNAFKVKDSLTNGAMQFYNSTKEIGEKYNIRHTAKALDE